MNYKDIMITMAEVVQDAGVSTKILQHMDRIRNNKSEESARRWVWELIQNAKDVAREGYPVNIKIERTEKELIFSHDGKPFLVKNILSIINQISSKTNDEESTGMFGTGFITTHQLSPIVTLKSVVQDSVEVNGVAEQLPCKEFEVVLDRSAENIDDITTSVKKSLDVVRNLDAHSDVEYIPENYNTQLTYELETEEAREIARKGLEDLKYSIFYALLFVEGISTVNVIEGDSNIVYKKGQVTQLEDEIEEYILYKNEEAYRFFMTTKEEVTIAVPVDTKENHIIPLDENNPKLYVDFPLVGSEKFPLPYICNSRRLHPAEKRNWISISANATTISDNNKEVMLQTLTLFESMLSYLTREQYKNVQYFANLLPIPTRDDLEQDWFKEQIHYQVIDRLLHHTIFEVNGEYEKISDELCIPFSMDNDDEVMAIETSLKMLADYKVIDCAISWNEILRKQPLEYRTKFHAITLEEINTKFLDPNIKLKEGVTFVEYINSIYQVMMKNQTMQNLIFNNELAIFPNMCEPVELCLAKDIGNGVNIPIEYIEIFEEIDKMNYASYQRTRECNVYPFRAKKTLLHKAFQLGENAPLVMKTLKGYFTNLNHICEFNNRYNLEDPLKDEIFLKIATLRNDKAYLDLFTTIGTEKQRDFSVSYDVVYDGDREQFVEYYKFLLRNLVKTVASYQNLSQMGEVLELEEEVCCSKIQSLVNLLVNEKLDKFLDDVAILPNKKGDFRKLSVLYRNDKIDETFLELSTKLQGIENSNLQILETILLHTMIEIKIYMKSYNNTSISSKLSNTVEQLLLSGELREQKEEHQEACAILLAWIDEYADKAKIYFPNFASEEARMRLLSSKSASILNKKVKACNNLLKEYGIDSLDELGKVLEELAKSEKGYSDEKIAIGDDDQYYEGLNRQDREAYIRRVGSVGEQIAFEQLKEGYLEQGYHMVSQNAKECELQKGDVQVNLYKPDDGNYHQMGWDIREITTDQEKCVYKYYEVKSTTARDRNNIFILKNAQFNLAMSVKERFSVIIVNLIPRTLDFNFTEMKENFFEHLQEGDVTCLNKEFAFRR